jgi:tRNA-dihydrouridine synthase A
VINGGIKTLDEVAEHLEHVDGVMLGREAYHNPYVLAGVDARFTDRLRRRRRAKRPRRS